MGIFDFDRAIVRRPSCEVVNGLRAGDHDGPSFEGVSREHDAYVSALQLAGLQVTTLAPAPEFPDSIFVEDPALVFSEGAILLRPGASSRMGEPDLLAPTLRDTFGVVLQVSEGRVDGGDIMVTPDKVIIGLSDRTDEQGARSLMRQLAALGHRGEMAQTPAGTLHFKSASSLVDEETVLATDTLAASGIFDGLRVLRVPEDEPGGANALRLNDLVLAGTPYPRTLDILARHGLNLISLDVTEIAKIDAGLSCMSLRWQSR